MDKVLEEGAHQAGSTYNRTSWEKDNFNSPRRPTGANSFPQTIPRNPTNAFLNIAAADPPRYSMGRYELYRKELLRRRDSLGGISDQKQIGILSLKADGVVRSILARCVESAGNDSESRTMQKLLIALDDEPAKTAHETSMAVISVRPAFGSRGRIYSRVLFEMAEIRPIANQVMYIALGMGELPLITFRTKTCPSEPRDTPGRRRAQEDWGSVTELRRLSAKMFESSPIEHPQDVLGMEITDEPDGVEGGLGYHGAHFVETIQTLIYCI